MAEQSTNTTPAVPVRAAIDALTHARAVCHEHLTPAEYDLLAAVDMLLRSRHGEAIEGAAEVARVLAEMGARALDAEAARS